MTTCCVLSGGQNKGRKIEYETGVSGSEGEIRRGVASDGLLTEEQQTDQKKPRLTKRWAEGRTGGEAWRHSMTSERKSRQLKDGSECGRVSKRKGGKKKVKQQETRQRSKRAAFSFRANSPHVQ